MTRMLWACVLALLPLGAARAGDESLKTVCEQLAKGVQDFTPKLKQKTIRLGLFTPFGIDQGSAGAAFDGELALALGKLIDRDSVIELSGTYGFVKDPKDPQLKVIKLTAKLTDTENGTVEKEFQPFEGFIIRSNTDIAKITGATVSFPPDSTLDNPTKDHNIQTQHAVPQRNGKPPEHQAFIEGSIVKASKESKFAVEVRKKKLGTPGDGKPVTASLHEGLAFVGIDIGELYEVRVLNFDECEIGVTLAIDGLDQFHFSEVREGDRPKYSRWVVAAAKDGTPGEFVIRGWHKDQNTLRAFAVTGFGEGAASKFPDLTSRKVGTITVSASRVVQGGKGGSETGFGPDIVQPQKEVKRSFDSPHEFISIRYNR